MCDVTSRHSVVSGPTLLLLGGAVAAVMYAIVSKAMAADELRRYRYHEELQQKENTHCVATGTRLNHLNQLRVHP